MKTKSFGSVLIFGGARIVPNPQRMASANALRVGTTRAPHTTRADEELDRKPVRQHYLVPENASARFAC
jgi:hypothetical protein